jgi:hypothetical protein
MIEHLVLFKFRPGFDRGHPQVQALHAEMQALPQHIGQIRAWEHGFNQTADVQAWDYALRSAFADEADLHAYFEHPAHLPLLARWETVAELAFADIAS